MQPDLPDQLHLVELSQCRQVVDLDGHQLTRLCVTGL
jgi:hypothetical protein